ncbi:hypothetical protein ACFX12_001071 [Malus domestica]
MSVTAGVSDTVIAVRDKLRGKIGQRKLQGIGPEKLPSGQMLPTKMGILGCSRQQNLPLRILILTMLGKMILGCVVGLKAGRITVRMLELTIGVSGKLILLRQLKRKP